MLSYGLYAWHGYGFVYWPWFQDRLVETFAVSLALAYASYHAVETPVGILRLGEPKADRTATS